MRVSACSTANRSPVTFNSSIPRRRVPNPVKLERGPEPDYGKGLKQLGFVIGMSILGLSSIILGTRGKLCGLKL